MPAAGHLLQTRPAYYDRSTVATSIVYAANGVAPHAFTTRATYTVPSSSFAMLDGCFARVLRATAAGASGRVAGFCIYTPSGGSALNVNEVDLLNNTAGTAEVRTVGQYGVLLPGDAVSVATSDASTTGTIDYQVSAKLFEFAR